MIYTVKSVNIINPYNKPTIMISVKNINRTKRSAKKLNKKQRENVRLSDKRSSPGVPPNTCPYVDVVKTMIDDMSDAYERLYENGEHQPKFDDIKKMADDTLEYIRRANECLRDNSLYWYNKYKQLL